MQKSIFERKNSKSPKKLSKYKFGNKSNQMFQVNKGIKSPHSKNTFNQPQFPIKESYKGRNNQKKKFYNETKFQKNSPKNESLFEINDQNKRKNSDKIETNEKKRFHTRSPMRVSGSHNMIKTEMYDSRAQKSITRDKIKRNSSCLLYTSPSPRDLSTSRMPSSA